MRKIFLLAGFALIGLCASAQNLILDEPVTVYEGDTVKIYNYENLIDRELFKDKKGMRGISVTSSLDSEEIERYRLGSMLATTEFVAVGIEKHNFGSKFFVMRNLVTDEIYGIHMTKHAKLEHYVVNLTQQRKVAQERYEHNLSAEKEMRGAWDKRINVVPYDMDFDIAAWNEKRIIIINGTEFSFADITGCELTSKEVYKPGEIDHVKLGKDLKKKNAWGGLLGGEVGAVAGAITAATSGVSEAMQRSELVTEYMVNITTGIKSRLQIGINVGTDQAKANEVVELITAIVASNEELKTE